MKLFYVCLISGVAIVFSAVVFFLPGRTSVLLRPSLQDKLDEYPSAEWCYLGTEGRYHYLRQRKRVVSLIPVRRSKYEHYFKIATTSLSFLRTFLYENKYTFGERVFWKKKEMGPKDYFPWHTSLDFVPLREENVGEKGKIQTDYFASGQTKAERSFLKNKEGFVLHGTSEEWIEDPSTGDTKLLERCFYKLGLLHGKRLIISYDKHYNKEWEENQYWCDGKRVGEWRRVDYLGKLLSKMDYRAIRVRVPRKSQR